MIQQIIEFFCAVVSDPVLGIVPLATAVLIVTDAPDICVYVSNGPGPFMLPAP